MRFNEDQLDIMLNMLFLQDAPRPDAPWRNFYDATNAQQEMMNLELLRIGGYVELVDAPYIYQATSKGIDATYLMLREREQADTISLGLEFEEVNLDGLIEEFNLKPSPKSSPVSPKSSDLLPPLNFEFT